MDANRASWDCPIYWVTNMGNELAAEDRFMRMALRLASKGAGLTSPNPCVGAVLVKEGCVIGRGWHRKAGGPHAEIEALNAARKAGHSAGGATLYVTLEPCSTQGRTPPCTEAIVHAGIKRVVCASTDANPKHSGNGFKDLKAHGVEVLTGILEEEAARMNRAFHHWITQGRPWVVAKIAMSLDGRIATRKGTPRWITSEAARRKAHEFRFLSDAILVGGETVRTDNPSLTIRLGKVPTSKLQPWRVVMTRSGNLPGKAHLYTDAHQERTLIYRNQSWRRVLNDLGKREVTSLLLEGGGKLLASALEAGVVDEVAFFIAPTFLGGTPLAVATEKFLGRGIKLENMSCEKVGPDFLLQAYVHRTR